MPVALAAAVVAVAAVIGVVVFGGGDEGPRSTVAITEGPGTVVTTATTTTVPPGTTTATTPPGTTSPVTTPPDTTPPEDPTWTVLVYMVADNDLEENALIDLGEMAEIPAREGLNLVVLADRSDEWVTGPAAGLDDWTTARTILIDGGQATVLEDLGEIDMGDPATLRRFVETGIAAFPAGHYAVILWDHGSTLFGIGPDRGSGDNSAMLPSEFVTALGEALDATGIARLDLIGFDACLMGSLETAAAVAPLARYLVASEEVEPLEGWEWTALSYLADEPLPTAAGLGSAIVTEYHRSLAGMGRPEHTLSLIDLDRVGDVTTALRSVVDLLAEDMSTYAPILGRQRNGVLAFGRNPDEWQAAQMIDLGHLLRRLARAEPALAAAADDLQSAIAGAVVAMENGREAKQAQGLAVFFPDFPDYWDAASAFYADLQAPVWPDLLAAFFGTGRSIPIDRRPTFSPIDGMATAEFVEPAGLQVTAGFAGALPDDIAGVRLRIGVPTFDGGVQYFSDIPGEVAGATASATHGLERVVLDDRGLSGAAALDGGAGAVFHRLSVTEDADGRVTTVEIPFAYYPPGGELGGPGYQSAVMRDHTVFDAASGEYTFSRDLYLLTASGTVGSVIPDPTGTLVPLLLIEAPDGARSWEPVLTGDPLAADLDAITLTIWTWGFPGTELTAEITVTDFGGNEASASVATVVPADWQTGVG